MYQSIGVNPGGFGGPIPFRSWVGSQMVGTWCLHEILLYPMMYRKYEMRTFSKVVAFHKQKHLWILNPEDDAINPVLRASVSWTFRIHDSPQPFFKPGQTTLSFQTRLTPLDQSQDNDQIQAIYLLKSILLYLYMHANAKIYHFILCWIWIWEVSTKQEP